MIVPDYVLEIFSLLENSGFEVFAVGGCVRDSLLGHCPSDWDITTSAPPDKILEVFSDFHTVPTGIKHGTITVFSSGEPIEITTYRIDGKYKDHRRPESVIFSSSLSDDLCRRDFTINAMAYNPKHGIIDLFGGIDDLKSRTVRCVGDAKTRFFEDSLRIMRALRFSAVLGFDIAPETAKAINDCSHLLNNIAKERICAEFSKLITAKNPEQILIDYKEVFSVILNIPTVNSDIWVKNCKTITSTEQIPALRLALVLNHLPYKEILRNLRYPNRTLNTVSIISEWMNIDFGEDKIAIKRILSKIGAEKFELVLKAKRALGMEPARLQYIAQTFKDILKSDECYTLKDLAVKGTDLIKTFDLKGNEIKIALNRLLDAVICGKCKNEKAALLNFAKDILSNCSDGL